MKFIQKSLIPCLILSFLSPHAHADKLKVIATNSIIGDWIHQVADNLVDLTILVGPNTDNHTFEPTPQDSIHLVKSNLIFENGLGLEYWLNPLYKSSQSKAKRIPLSNKLPNLIKIDCHHHQCSHAHNEFDPHTWLNPKNAILMIQTIANTLIHEDPQNAQLYQERSQNYIQELNELNSWIIAQIALIPPNNRKLITNHDSFRYFAQEYNFTTLGDVLGSNSTENIDPSATHFAKLVQIIKKNKVPAIFGETIQNPTLINKLAAEANLPQPHFLYTEALSQKEGPADNYIKLMKFNIDTLVQNLK